MNNDRRADLRKAAALVTDAVAIINGCKDEEQDYFDNMPDSFQQGDKGEKATAAIDALDEAINALEGVEGNIETACE